ncbi:hypothetical protein RA988_22140, partial [Mycobacteroides abscessus subsp. massiliense]
YELAVTQGIPREADHLTAAEVLRGLHRGRDRTAIEVLNRYIENSDVVARLAKLRDRSWRDVRPGGGIAGPFFTGLATVLGAADSYREIAARQRVWTALIGDATPYNLGASVHGDVTAVPWSIVEIGLS